jgi:hypothetical protein
LSTEALPRVLDGGAVFRSAAHISAKSGEDIVFTVKGIDPSGRAMSFACGTDEQAMEKTWELRRRGFRDVVVVDHKGKELGDVAFERSLKIEWD